MRGLVRVLLLGLVGIAAMASAGDQPPGQARASAPTGAATPAPQQKDDIEDFVPSQRVGADDAVTFPVDI